METKFSSYTPRTQLSQMIFAIFFFHTSEYFLAIFFHGKSNAPLSSLLISKHYVFAMGFSILEYVIELFLFPEIKEYWWISNIGLGLVLIGEVIRKLAIITAGRSFTHLIRTRRDDGHQLITHGVYRFIRHPGYCGFFIWAVGTQIMILNPCCTLAFVLVLWRFFSGRIIYEEYFLRQFFGPEYIAYAQGVPSGVPFVK
ncbi:protein-S-isoprenylcysteine O-methyltransferase [Ranunculus cassubicifolius]